jgi:ferredoxin
MINSASSFTVTLIDESQQIKQAIAVSESEIVLDVAKDRNVELPYSCCAGSCLDCLGKVVSGTVEQTPQALTFLKPEEIAAGYVLLCSATPTSDCAILTHQAAVLLGEN